MTHPGMAPVVATVTPRGPTCTCGGGLRCRATGCSPRAAPRRPAPRVPRREGAAAPALNRHLLRCPTSSPGPSSAQSCGGGTCARRRGRCCCWSRPARRTRALRAAVRPDQPRHAGHVDPLPRPADRRAAGRRQRLLPRLPDGPGPRHDAEGARAEAALAGRLHGKWLALPLFAAVLFAQVFDLWEDPAATAWLILGYFAGAIVVDTLFSGASFCKHVCPVGQFNFVASTLSPLEIRPKDHAVCASCRTFDCLKGRRAPEAPRWCCSAAASCTCSCDQDRQPRVHVLPGLRAGLPLRQRRACGPRSRRGAERRSTAVGHRPPVASTRLRPWRCCSRSARSSTPSR